MKILSMTALVLIFIFSLHFFSDITDRGMMDDACQMTDNAQALDS